MYLTKRATRRLLAAVLAGTLTAACSNAPTAPATRPPGTSPATASGPASSAASGPASDAGPGAASSATAGPLPAGFVALSDVDPGILTDIRYATAHNFVGRPVAGYLRPRCLLTRAAADALHTVQAAALRQGYRVKVYDCYRPQRGVDDFVHWATTAEERMKPEFYPAVDKSALFPDGYIGGPTAHSRGSTLDLTLVADPPRAQPEYRTGEVLRPCTAPATQRFPDNTIDMGTGFDCFDPLAHTAAGGIPDPARSNRALLTGLMARAGFVNYPKEWWHYTLAHEPFPDTYYDFPVA